MISVKNKSMRNTRKTQGITPKTITFESTSPRKIKSEFIKIISAIEKNGTGEKYIENIFKLGTLAKNNKKLDIYKNYFNKKPEDLTKIKDGISNHPLFKIFNIKVDFDNYENKLIPDILAGSEEWMKDLKEVNSIFLEGGQSGGALQLRNKNRMTIDIMLITQLITFIILTLVTLWTFDDFIKIEILPKTRATYIEAMRELQPEIQRLEERTNFSIEKYTSKIKNVIPPITIQDEHGVPVLNVKSLFERKGPITIGGLVSQALLTYSGKSPIQREVKALSNNFVEVFTLMTTKLMNEIIDTSFDITDETSEKVKEQLTKKDVTAAKFFYWSNPLELLSKIFHTGQKTTVRNLEDKIDLFVKKLSKGMIDVVRDADDTMTHLRYSLKYLLYAFGSTSLVGLTILVKLYHILVYKSQQQLLEDVKGDGKLRKKTKKKNKKQEKKTRKKKQEKKTREKTREKTMKKRGKK